MNEKELRGKKKDTNGGRTGRRGIYHDWITKEGLVKLEGWAKDGLTDEQIAHNIGINRTTLYAWKNRYPDINNALKKGKEVVDREVENALHKSAMGYYVEEVKEEHNPKFKTTVTTRTKKWIPANTTAQIFWLKNRKPEEWRDKTETQITGEMDIGEKATVIDKYLDELDDDE